MPIVFVKRAEKAKPKATKRTGHTLPRAPLIPVTMPGRYSTGNIMAITGWSHTKLSQRIRDNLFPPPLKDGHINYWPTDVVKAALSL